MESDPILLSAIVCVCGGGGAGRCLPGKQVEELEMCLPQLTLPKQTVEPGNSYKRQKEENWGGGHGRPCGAHLSCHSCGDRLSKGRRLS